MDGASQLLTGAELEQGGALSCRQIEGRVTEPSPGARGQPAKNAGERDPPGPTRVPPRCRGPTRPRAGAGATSEIQGIGERSGCRVPRIRGKREWRRQLKRTEERPSSSRLSTGPTVRRSTPLAGGKQGAETSRPRARKPLATVRCREPVNGVRPPRRIQPPEQVGPQPVGRVETRDRKSARTFSSRGRQTGIREKSPCSCISCSESARRWRAGLGAPPDTNSPQGRPPRANAGTTPPRMWTQPRLSSTTRCLPPARRERTVLTRAQCRAFHGGWSWPISGRRGAGP